MRIVCLAVAMAALALPLPGQSRAQLKKELQTQETRAGKDADALLAVARWAKENGLLQDHERLLNQVLQLDPDQEEARAGLGFVRYEGEWLAQEEAEARREQARRAAFEAAGLIEVEGVWVEEDHVEDAKKGIFHHDDELVSKADKLAFLAGKVRHPRTGRMIAAEDLAKAEEGGFPVGDGKWVAEAEANEYHASMDHPWVLRSYYADVITTLPLAEFAQIKGIVDGSIDSAKLLFGGRETHPGFRPAVVVCATTDQYRDVGNAIGAEHSVYGGFLALADRARQRFRSASLPVTPAVANYGGVQGWGEYYLRHGAALAYAQSLATEAKADLPYWIVCGVGSLAERHMTNAAFFGQQHLTKGGVKDLESWFAEFEISADVPVKQVEYNVFQAGLMLAFGMWGGDAEATAALQAWTGSFAAGSRAVEEAAQELERVLTAKEAEVRDYLKRVVQKG